MTRKAATGWRATRRLSSDEEELGGWWFSVAVEMIYLLFSVVVPDGSGGVLAPRSGDLQVLVIAPWVGLGRPPPGRQRVGAGRSRPSTPRLSPAAPPPLVPSSSKWCSESQTPAYPSLSAPRSPRSTPRRTSRSLRAAASAGSHTKVRRSGRYRL